MSSPAGCRSSDAVCRWSGGVAADPPDEWRANCRPSDNLPGKAAYNGFCCRGHGVETATVLGAIAMAEKAVNYTAEQTAKIIADYQAGVKVEDIASAMGKTVRSIVA